METDSKQTTKSNKTKKDYETITGSGRKRNNDGQGKIEKCYYRDDGPY